MRPTTIGRIGVARYRTTAEDMEVIGPACGTLWERPIIEKVLRNKLPDVDTRHLSLSDCDIGTIEFTLSDHNMSVIRRCGGFREYANEYINGPIL